MKGYTLVRSYALALLLGLSGSFSSRAADNSPSTNWIENTITNVIEVRMARNRLINEYRTNWIERVRTNVFDIYRTNHLTRSLTNRLVVDAWGTNSVNLFRTNWHQLTLTNAVALNRVRTNFVDSYHTNWKSLKLTNDIVLTRFQTNFVDSFRTNWKQLTLTNSVVVSLARTNTVDLYKTNWQNLNLTNEVVVNRAQTNFVAVYTTNVQTLSLTNRETVVVMKTNWVTQFLTNAVQLDMPKPVAVSQRPAERSPASSSSLHTASTSSGSNDDPVIEVSRTTKPPGNGLVEVELKIKWPADTVDAPPVQQWRIERGDGAFLSFGQEQEFKKELPVGNYTVEARLQRDADSPSFLLRGTLAVTIKEAIVQQRTDRTKVASVSENRP